MLCNYTLTMLYVSIHQGKIVIGTLKVCVYVVTIRNSKTLLFETEDGGIHFETWHFVTGYLVSDVL